MIRLEETYKEGDEHVLVYCIFKEVLWKVNSLMGTYLLQIHGNLVYAELVERRVEVRQGGSVTVAVFREVSIEMLNEHLPKVDYNIHTSEQYGTIIDANQTVTHILLHNQDTLKELKKLHQYNVSVIGPRKVDAHILSLIRSLDSCWDGSVSEEQEVWWDFIQKLITVVKIHGMGKLIYHEIQRAAGRFMYFRDIDFIVLTDNLNEAIQYVIKNQIVIPKF